MKKRKFKEYTVSSETEKNTTFQASSSTPHLEGWTRYFRHRHSIKPYKKYGFKSH